jgi:hypothetical protein
MLQLALSYFAVFHHFIGEKKLKIFSNLQFTNMKCSLMDEMLANLSLKAELLDNANKDVSSNFLLQNTNM